MNYVGWDNIFTTVEREVGIAGFDPTVPVGTRPPTEEAASPDGDPEEQVAAASGGFGWEYIVWMGFLGLVSCAIWPTAVARALAMDSPQAVKRQYMLASVSFLIRFLIPCFWGICALVFVLQNDAMRELFFPAGYPQPEMLPEGVEPFDNLYAMPIFLGRILPVGVIGIITAGMVAAFMSTHDSYLLCWSSVLTQDVVAPIYEKGKRVLSRRARITLTRIFIVVIGVYVLGWGLIYHGSDDIWDYMAVTGAIYYNGAFALLMGGLYWKRASSTGAFLALLAGILAVLGLSPVQHGVSMALNAMAGSSSNMLELLSKLPAVDLVQLIEDGRNVTRLDVQRSTGPCRFDQHFWHHDDHDPGVAVVSRSKEPRLLSFGTFGRWLMSLENWMLLWKIVLIGGIGLFAVLAILVSIGGFFNVRRLFKTLHEQHAAREKAMGSAKNHG